MNCTVSRSSSRVSRGLGVETAPSLAAHGSQIVGAARNLTKVSTGRKTCYPYKWLARLPLIVTGSRNAQDDRPIEGFRYYRGLSNGIGK